MSAIRLNRELAAAAGHGAQGVGVRREIGDLTAHDVRRRRADLQQLTPPQESIMHTSDSQFAKDARKAAEIALGGLIIALQAAAFFGVLYYLTNG
jgi:hypothetical protein